MLSLENARPFFVSLFGYEGTFDSSNSFHMAPVVKSIGSHESNDNVTVQLPKKLAEAILTMLAKGVTEDDLINHIRNAQISSSSTTLKTTQAAAAPLPPPPPPPPPLPPVMSRSRRLGRSSRVIIKVQNHRIPIELATDDLEKIRGTTTSSTATATATGACNKRASFGLTLDDIRMGAKCLRKVAKTSPGGTPVRVRRPDGNSPQSILARALMRKFRNVRTPSNSPCRRRGDFMRSAAAVMESPSAFDEEEEEERKIAAAAAAASARTPVKKFDPTENDYDDAEKAVAGVACGGGIDGDDVEVSIPTETTPLLVSGTPQTPLKTCPSSPSKKRKTIC